MTTAAPVAHASFREELPLELPPTLRALTLDLARHLQRHGGGLAVDVAHLPDGLGRGLAAQVGHDRAIIVAPKLPAAELAEVFAHEVAHVLDTLDGRVTWSGSPRNRRRRESFANRLGSALLENGPTTVAAARPLMAAARRTTPQTPTRRRS